MASTDIILTGRRPVRIDGDAWPVIARAAGDNWHGDPDPARYIQASQQGDLDEYELIVRRHADGRHLVYGSYSKGHFSRHAGPDHAGELVPAGDSSVEHAIERVGGTLLAGAKLIADCVADLPPERLDDALTPPPVTDAEMTLLRQIRGRFIRLNVPAEIGRSGRILVDTADWDALLALAEWAKENGGLE